MKDMITHRLNRISQKEIWLLLVKVPISRFSITALLVLGLFSFTGIEVYGQSPIIIKVDVEQQTFESIAKSIERKYGYKFFYQKEDVDKIPARRVKVESTSIRVVLDELLRGTGLSYKVERMSVFILSEKDRGVQFQTTIRGRVLNEKKESIPGVAVLIKGTSRGTITDENGLFNLNVSGDEKIVLVFSFIGMKKLERTVLPHERKIEIQMTENAVRFDEIVVTGYETVSKRKLTGSVSTINSDKLLEPTGLTVDNMLQGKVSGVNILQNSSTPGVAPKIRIRGSSSILGNREPIWVVDGIVLSDPVKISNAELNSMDKVNLIGNAISFLNPQDIDRIDILKDASATAIYGAKSANGVIVITTKRGKMGRMSVNYSFTGSVKEKPRYSRLNLMNSDERVQVSQEIQERGLAFPQGSNPLIGYEGLLSDFWNKKITYDDFNKQVDQIRATNTDWFDELLRVPFSQGHNLSLSGGNENTTYYLSGNLTDDKDIQLKSGVKRQTVNANITTHISKKLTLSTSLGASFANTNRTHSSIDLMGYANTTSRAINLYDQSGTLYSYPRINADLGPNVDNKYVHYNILNELDHTGNTQKNHNINTNMLLTYRPHRDISINAQFAYALNSVKMEEWADEQSYYVTSQRQVPYGFAIPDNRKANIVNPFGGEYKYSLNQNSTTNGRLSANYNLVLGKHSFDFMAGSDISSVIYSGTSQNLLGYYPNRGKTFATNVPMEYLAYHKKVANSSPMLTDNISNTLSFYGVTRYSFNNKYILNFNIRTDGSNKFGQDKRNRFLPIWSISGRWNLTNEAFLADRLSFLDQLSVKASYGFQGNVQDDQTPFMIIRQGAFNATAQQFSNTLVRYPNPLLTWEKTSSYNVGLEWSLFKGFVSGGIEIYSKVGKDQIVSKRVTPDNGASAFVLNQGTILNQGWDLSLAFNFIQRKDMFLGLSLNTGMNKNTVSDSGDPNLEQWGQYLSGELIRDGYPVNSFYSYRFGGLDKNGLPTFNGIDFLNPNYNGEIKDLKSAINSAMVLSGRREPVSAGGISLNFRYKSITLSSAFSYSLGSKIRLNDLYDNDNQSVIMPIQNLSRELIDRWKTPGDELRTNVPVLSDLPLRAENVSYNGENSFVVSKNYWQMYNKSDIRVVPGDYLRCTSLSLGYSLPKDLLKRTGVKSCLVSLGCNNLFTIASKLLKGQSPETFVGTRVIPPQRTYSVSMNLSF